MLTVFRTTCCTDWKCRPSHDVVVVGRAENQEEAVKEMDIDIRAWMAVDVATNEYNELEEAGEEPNDDWTMKRIEELLLMEPVELGMLWQHENRWEMERDDDGSDVLRKFAETNEGDRVTTVYHFIEL